MSQHKLWFGMHKNGSKKWFPYHRTADVIPSGIFTIHPEHPEIRLLLIMKSPTNSSEFLLPIKSDGVKNLSAIIIMNDKVINS